MSKRDLIVSKLEANSKPGKLPVAFFSHFDLVYHRGQAATNNQLKYFRYTGMALFKIPFELPMHQIEKPENWACSDLSRYAGGTVQVVRAGLKLTNGNNVCLTIQTTYGLER